ncbi:unnamed protein product [Prunus brigantina]
MAVCPRVPHAPASSESSVAQPLKTAKVTRVTNSRINIGYDERHRAAPTADQHSSLAHDIGHVVRTYCPMKWKSWKAMPDEVRITDEMWAYINRLFAERHKQWKSDLHHHFQTYDDPQVALQEGCPKELEGRADSWEWLCGHFQEADFLGGSKFPEIDVFGDVYVRPGDELAESLHVFDDDREEPVGSSRVRLPASSRYAARVRGSST